MAKASPAAGRPERAQVLGAVARLLDATADPQGRGLLLRGQEFKPLRLGDLAASEAAMAVAAEGSLRLARLAASLPEALRDHPDPAVRRAAAVLAARAHPLLAAADA